MADPKTDAEKLRQQRRIDKKAQEELRRYEQIHREVERVADHYRNLPKSS